MPALSRRRLLLGAAVSAALPAVLPAALRAEAAPRLHVLKDPGCGCCDVWIEILRAEGFGVEAENVTPGRLAAEKAFLGIPAAFASCHTATVEGYAIEGHVPPADIRRLLALRPAARGLAVPGMPFGSPGMGPETAREAYDVVLIRPDGRGEVFARYEAA